MEHSAHVRRIYPKDIPPKHVLGVFSVSCDHPWEVDDPNGLMVAANAQASRTIKNHQKPTKKPSKTVKKPKNVDFLVGNSWNNNLCVSKNGELGLGLAEWAGRSGGAVAFWQTLYSHGSKRQFKGYSWSNSTWLAGESAICFDDSPISS